MLKDGFTRGKKEVKNKTKILGKELEKTEEAAFLRHAGFKTTAQRVAILRVLKKATKPLSILQIKESLDESMNETTLYRALLALVDTHVVKKIDFGHNHAHYELSAGREHHHHVVCKDCGDVEDVKECNIESLQKSALKKSKKFSHITDHSLEFFGICDGCANK